MDILNIIILSLIQGITEFLPISSSSHLILIPMLTEYPDQGVMFDIALHTGSLLAVIIYYKREIIKALELSNHCLLYTSPSPRDRQKSRMPSSA